MEWYYTKDGEQVGPVTKDQLIQKISVGEVISNQLAWNESMADWEPISAIPELQLTSGSGQVMPPPMVQSPAAPVQVASGPARTSALSVVSLCLGAISFLMCGFGIVTAIPAIICGHLGLREIKRSPERMEGKPMAVIGLIFGYVITALNLLFFSFFALAAVAASDGINEYDDAEDFAWGEAIEESTSLEDLPADGVEDRLPDPVPTPAD